MTAYFVVMSAIICLGLFAPKQFQWPVRIIAFIALLIFCGGRIEVGPDWYSYILYQNYLVSGFADNSLLSEPGFTYISLTSEWLGWGIVGTNMATACIFLIGLFSLIGRTPYPWCALAVAFCYYIPTLPMGLIRQAAAIGIILWLISYWERTTLWQRLGLIVFAMSFHVSAIIMFGVVFAALRISIWHRAFAIISVGVLLLGLRINPLDYFGTYNDRYIAGVGGVTVETTAATMHWMLVAAPGAWYIYMRKRLSFTHIPSDVMTISSLIAVGLIVILPISSAAVTRLAMYFSYLPILVGGMMVMAYQTPITRIVLRTGILSASFGILAVWLNFAENSEPYKPYQNYLIVDSIKRNLYTG